MLSRYISQCGVCNSQPTAQARESMVCEQVLDRPWEKIAIDFFEVKGKDYVITVEYYASIFDVD